MNAFKHPNAKIYSWQDSVEAGAKGWVVIDSIVNGLAGGGLFMHAKATLDEVADLAKTMSFKNTLLNPVLGGAKAGIRFDPHDPKAKDVIRRFLLDHKYLLEDCWTTGADLNIPNDFIFDVLEKDLKLSCAFHSLGKMLNTRFSIPVQSAFLRERLSTSLGGHFTLENAATGYSVANTIELLGFSKKPKIMIQGFGAVGKSLCYFLNKHHIATIVGISDVNGFIYKPEGIFLNLETRNISTNSPLEIVLSDAEKRECHWSSRLKDESDENYLCRFLSCQSADIFSPCATRYQLSKEVANTLLNMTFKNKMNDTEIQKKYIVSGANNSFKDDQVRIHLESAGVTVVPEWVSNSGTTILFTESMMIIPKDQTWKEYVLGVIRKQLKIFINKKMLQNELNSKKFFYSRCHDLALSRLTKEKEYTVS